MDFKVEELGGIIVDVLGKWLIFSSVFKRKTRNRKIICYMFLSFRKKKNENYLLVFLKYFMVRKYGKGWVKVE